jgi:hypothetical protein
LTVAAWTLADIDPVNWTFADAVFPRDELWIAVRKRLERPKKWAMIRVESRSRIQNEEMSLDLQAHSRDQLTPDHRFDGKFFIGVVGIGIVGRGVYYRPISPAPIAKEKNVRYFPSAAAAPRIAASPGCNISNLPVGV